eukprot:UN15785
MECRFLYRPYRSLKLEIFNVEKSFSSKHEVLSKYPNSILGLIFQNIFFLFLAYNLIGVPCGHGFLLAQNLGQSDLSDTPNMLLKSTEIF